MSQNELINEQLLVCPIPLKIMVDPVSASDGQVFNPFPSSR
jgi:hypothetical protein